MTYEEYIAKVTPLLERFNNAVEHHCHRTAEARVRDMARVYAEYRGISYEEAFMKTHDKLFEHTV